MQWFICAVARALTKFGMAMTANMPTIATPAIPTPPTTIKTMAHVGRPDFGVGAPGSGGGWVGFMIIRANSSCLLTEMAPVDLETQSVSSQLSFLQPFC